MDTKGFYSLTRSAENILPSKIQVHYDYSSDALYFETEEDLRAVLLLLSNSGNFDSLSNLCNNDFRSFFKCYEEYYDEAEKLIQSAPEYYEASIRVKNLNERYSGFLLFDESGLGYLRAKNPLLSKIANRNGEYYVGNKLRTIETYSNVSEILNSNNCISKGIGSESSYLRANNAGGRTRSRKVFMQISFDPMLRDVTIWMSAQQSFLWGLIWNIYPTEYHALLSITNLTVPFKLRKSDNINIDVEIPRKSERIRVNDEYLLLNTTGGQQHKVYINTTRDLSEFSFCLGNFVPKDGTNYDGYDYTVSCKMMGTMEIWSRGVPYPDRGVDVIDVNFLPKQ